MAIHLRSHLLPSVRFSLFCALNSLPPIKTNLEVEKFFQNLHGFLRALDGVANGSLVAEDLVIVAALEGLVSEEMDVLVGDSVGLLGLAFEVAQAVGLVPASGEDVE